MVKRLIETKLEQEKANPINHANSFIFCSSNLLFKFCFICLILIKNYSSQNFSSINGYTNHNNGNLYKLDLQPIDCTSGKAIIGFHLNLDTEKGNGNFWAYEYSCYSSGIYFFHLLNYIPKYKNLDTLFYFIRNSKFIYNFIYFKKM